LPTTSPTRPDLDTTVLAERLRPVLLRLGRELRREARSLGISATHVSLLSLIEHWPGVGVKELADRERMSPAGMSGHVDALVRAGLVRRIGNERDRRRVDLALTAAGRSLLRKVRSRRTAWLAQRLGKLSGREIAALEAAIVPLGLLLDVGERP